MSSRGPHRKQAQRSTCALLLFALFVLSAGACDRGRDAGEAVLPSAPAAVDPCRLVTRQEVQTALGSPVREGEQMSGGIPAVSVVGMKFCVFRPVETGKPSAQVGAADDFAAEAFDKYKNDPVNHPLVPVSDLATEAVWFPRNNTLVALQGDVVFAVYLAVSGSADQQRRATRLARLIAGRL